MTGNCCRWLLVACGLGLVAFAQAAPDNASSHLLQRDGRQLEILISPRFEPAMRDNLLQWVDYISAALAQVYGHWPKRRWQIRISPTAASTSDPIPWALVHRGDVNEVEFYTAAYASPEELKRAWTGYHELAHLLIPYRGWGDVWFSEGLASYYQNILQARAGILSEQQMWQKLYEGFQRGIAERRYDGQPLSVVSEDMRKNGGFMRVYWSGAWYFLAADSRLRLQSGGKLTLDTALAKLNACCAEKRMSVAQIVTKLDELNQVLLFSALFDEVAAATSVPPFDTIFASLGVDVVDGEVKLQERGPGARLRHEIVDGATPPTG